MDHTALTLEELRGCTPMTNHILVRITKFNNILKRGGVEIFLDTSYEEGRNAPTFAQVVAVCDNLTFSKQGDQSMNWDVPMEVEVGDYVIYRYLAYLNAKNSDFENGKLFVLPEDPDAEYLFIHYRNIYAALRESQVPPETIRDLEEEEIEEHGFVVLDGGVFDLIVCNGFVLVEPVVKKIETTLHVPEYLKDQHDNVKFIVRHVGCMVKEYFDGPEELRGGDRDVLGFGDVVYSENSNHDVPIQYDLHKILNKQYFRIQRRYLTAIEL